MNRKRIVFIIATGIVCAVCLLAFRGRHRINVMDRPALQLGDNIGGTTPTESDHSPLTGEDKLSAAQVSPWGRFRGPNGLGLSEDSTIPVKWSDTRNLAWKTALPGAGSSSPVLTDGFVFVTCYSGYGVAGDRGGSPNQLQRHVCCIDRDSGAMVWTRTVSAVQQEDRYQGMGLPEHGYATNTPGTDGAAVFAFLGKSGVYAFDLSGKELWHVSVGTGSGNREWGSASSLILYKDLVIVNAAEESQSLYALSKDSGEVIWKSPAAALELCYSTPAIAHVSPERDDLILAVPGEVWGINPGNGKLIWFAETPMTDNLSPSVLVDGATVYAFGGYRNSGSVSLRAGGKGDVTSSHMLWTSKNTSHVATPVLLNNRLQWVDDHGVYFCADAKSGELIQRARTSGISSGGRPVYASPVSINQRLYVQSRYGGVFVLERSPELTILEQNRFASDSSNFNATPAVDRGQLFLRSDRYLYCISASHPTE
ncbi:MAG: PQQ-binding-like beta-propeller repeat protein [Planctomycetaceae bacterium]